MRDDSDNRSRPGSTLFQLRIRADHPDGTVSNYVTTTAYVPPTPPAPPVDPGDGTLGPVTFSNPQALDHNPRGWDGTLSVSPFTNPNDPGLSDQYAVQPQSVHRTDDTLNIIHDAGVFEGGFAGNGDFSLAQCDFVGTTGATYSVLADLQDVYTGAASLLSAPVSITVAGTLPAKLSITADNPASDGSDVVHWTPPSGITGTVSIYDVVRRAGRDSAYQIGNSIPLTDGHATVYPTPGDSKLLAVYNGYNADGTIYGFSPYSDKVDVTVPPSGPPAAPAWVKAVIDPQNAGRADVIWQNTSNNEAAFKLQESVDGGLTWTLVKTFKKDETSTNSDAVDISNLQPGTVEFEVLADTPDSQPTTSNALSIPLIFLVAGNLQVPNAHGVWPPGTGVNTLRSMLISSGKFTSSEIKILASDPAPGFNPPSPALTTNLQTQIQNAAQLANKRELDIALVGYSWGGGLIADACSYLTNTMTMPTNVRIKDATYIDGIHYSLIFAAETGVILGATHSYSYYQSIKDSGAANSPHGGPIPGAQNFDLDQVGAEDWFPGALAYPWPALRNLFTHTTIDKDLVLLAKITQDLTGAFGR